MQKSAIALFTLLTVGVDNQEPDKMKWSQAIEHDFKTDATWNRAARLSRKGAHALPRATAQYLVEKVPIVEWLPQYNPRWIINDIVAGLTLGLMLIPQSLSYAKLATIPVQYGLMSSWLPAALYAVMGTTKGQHTLACYKLLS